MFTYLIRKIYFCNAIKVAFDQTAQNDGMFYSSNSVSAVAIEPSAARIKKSWTNYMKNHQ